MTELLGGLGWQSMEFALPAVRNVLTRHFGLVENEQFAMLARLPRRPRRVLFRLAIEETESWFIADLEAVVKAYPKAKQQKLRGIVADDIVGAWEKLADALNIKPSEVTGADKYAWAERISPHLNLKEPHSPSLGKFIAGISREVSRP